MKAAPEHRILLQPVGTEIKAAAGASLRDLLFEQGVEFPCGGQGRCRGCKVRVLQGSSSVNAAQREHLSPQEVADGWRLACQSSVEGDLVIELRQWDAAILANDTPFIFTPRDGLGVAVDLGTTTLVAQLLDLHSGHVLAVRTALNPQARYGGDVMSRVQFALADGGHGELARLIRKQIGTLIHQLLTAAAVERGLLQTVVLVGNTVMHHLFCEIDLEPLSRYPFEPVQDGLQRFAAGDLGWELDGEPTVQFLPCLGGFVGSDILAGALATGLHESEELVGLIDLGTNGEIVLGNRHGMLCASTAAGPAFEGARISTGMRAATGAIWKVAAREGEMRCEVLGNVAARGICGSGLVDAVAAGLDLGLIKPSGRLAGGGDVLPLQPPVSLTQTDIRQLQLAKGAIAAGIRILLQRRGQRASSVSARGAERRTGRAEDVTRLYLAGAFGNYVDRASARRIGLIDFSPEKVQPVGNAALLGAKLALFSLNGDAEAYAPLRSKIEHIPLSADPAFQEIYVEEMSFPAG
jgi:uncharacterized 2Fe-2S/4Fe-4S cluster protein (DUF4445 family)